MSFFSQAALDVLGDASRTQGGEQPNLVLARNELCKLHDAIIPEFQKQNLDLHSLDAEQCFARTDTIADTDVQAVVSIPYLRSRAQAVGVERLLGREEVASVEAVEARRHPAIELRLTVDCFTIEFVISPAAWWDQQNLMGKLSIARHRQAIYSLLKTLDVEYCLGFWQGTHLSDMHLTANQFQHPRVMDEWMSTFSPGQDWFRLGIWYAPDDEALAGESGIELLLNHVRLLYPLYKQIIWASDNNYRDFYLNKST